MFEDAVSKAVMLLIGGGSGVFLRQGCKKAEVEGLDGFLKRLNSGRGVLTVSNHVSVCDDPVMWGVLPLSSFLGANTIRWTLGASDVMFTNKLHAWFFNKGQVIETFRGKGIYQPAIDLAARKLDAGRWVHIFPEGRIKQENLPTLRRFKWGVSRMLLETRTPQLPDIVPIWIQGFENVLHESRGFPRPVPRIGKSVKIVFGEPLNARLEPVIERIRQSMGKQATWRPGDMGRDVEEDLEEEPNGLRRARIEIAELLRQGVMELGAKVQQQEAEAV